MACGDGDRAAASPGGERSGHEDDDGRSAASDPAASRASSWPDEMEREFEAARAAFLRRAGLPPSPSPSSGRRRGGDVLRRVVSSPSMSTGRRAGANGGEGGEGGDGGGRWAATSEGGGGGGAAPRDAADNPKNEAENDQDDENDFSARGLDDPGLARRLDAAWAGVEEEFGGAGRSSVGRSPAPRTPPKDANVISPERPEERSPLLAAHPSDATLQTSNATPSPLSNECGGEATGATFASRPARKFQGRCGGAPSSGAFPCQMAAPPQRENGQMNIAAEPVSKVQRSNGVLERYRRFLRRHEPSLDLIQHATERFLFYGYLFHNDRAGGVHVEIYYALWNAMRVLNDVVLEGCGEGMGTTAAGTRDEWLPLECAPGASPTRAPLRAAIAGLRATLTAAACLHPAVEAWSRRPPRRPPGPRGAPLSPATDEEGALGEGSFATTADASPLERRRDWEAGRLRAARASHGLERVRFLARLALLSIAWWARERRRRRGTRDGEEGGTHPPPPTPLPLLKRGGELDPYERPAPLADAEREARAARYVGRRTGRRSVSGRSLGRRTSARDPSLGTTPSRPSASNLPASLAGWLSGLASSENKVTCLCVAGELLHILRPLYWSRAEGEEWKRRSAASSSGKAPRGPTSSSLALWRVWLTSLAMDLISDRLLRLARGGDAGSNIGARQRSRRGVDNDPPSVEWAEREEMERRRGRLGLHLLRSPMYNAVTRPLAVLIGRLVSAIPSFGMGQWAAEYALDAMGYWNDNRFMLES